MLRPCIAHQSVMHGWVPIAIQTVSAVVVDRRGRLAVSRGRTVWLPGHIAWTQLTARPLPDQTERMTVTAMQFAGTQPALETAAGGSR